MDKPSLAVLECTMGYLLHPQTDCESFFIHDNLSSHLDFIVKQNPIHNSYCLVCTQQKILCSLVLKLKKRAALYFQVLTGALDTVYHESSALFLKMYQVLFST